MKNGFFEKLREIFFAWNFSKNLKGTDIKSSQNAPPLQAPSTRICGAARAGFAGLAPPLLSVLRVVAHILRAVSTHGARLLPTHQPPAPTHAPRNPRTKSAQLNTTQAQGRGSAVGACPIMLGLEVPAFGEPDWDRILTFVVISLHENFICYKNLHNSSL